MMRSRAARLTLGAAASIALLVATYFVVTTENVIAARRNALRSFDVRARNAAETLDGLRAAQQAYVAAGQGVAIWRPKVDALVDAAGAAIDELRQTATAANGRQSLMEGAATLVEFGTIDRRVREYLSTGDELMAGDVIFTEGSERATTAARHVEAARVAEHDELERTEVNQRRREASVAGGTAGFAALVILLLSATGTRGDNRTAEPEPLEPLSAADPVRFEPELRRQPSNPDSAVRHSVPALKAAAELCTDFGRAHDLNDLTKVLGRAAGVMDASGVIVWLGNTSGADLRPVLAHGYPSHALSRMPSVARSADNAAAAAYRSGALQIVLSRPGAANGAVVAPLLSVDGCIGALTAEIKGGSETADSVQALAAIFAAQLAGVLAGSVPHSEDAERTRTATA